MDHSKRHLFFDLVLVDHYFAELEVAKGMELAEGFTSFDWPEEMVEQQVDRVIVGYYH